MAATMVAAVMVVAVAGTEAAAIGLIALTDYFGTTNNRSGISLKHPNAGNRDSSVAVY